MIKTIFYELNEVPRRLFEFYASAFPNSAFACLSKFSRCTETHTADLGHLSPWITWPTLHRGVSNVEHQITDIGQDLNDVNKDFPPIWELLSSAGINVGVFGSLQSYPTPKNTQNYSFFVPDTFAASPECFPSDLDVFQAFNLSMVRTNGRNVSGGLPFRNAKEFLVNSFALGLTPTTMFCLAKQLISETTNRDRLVRRRTSHAEIAFDLFFHQLKLNRPDVSFFFTNHVASSMHRYWPTIFPQDYSEGRFDIEWRSRWQREIPHAIKVANEQLHRLIKFCDVNSCRLIVLSSMGQAAVKSATSIKTQVLITDLGRLMEFIGISKDEWEPRLSMAPRIVFKPITNQILCKIRRLEKIKINGHTIKVKLLKTGDIRLHIHLVNVERLEISENGSQIDPATIGISNVNLQDAAGSYAYHIPQGILLDYQPNMRKNLKRDKGVWEQCSVLDVAPSLLNSYNIDQPSFMKGDNGLF